MTKFLVKSGYKLFILVCLIVQAYSADNFLGPDKNLGRTCKVFGNKIQVRLKTGNYDISKLNEQLKKSNATATFQFLKPQETFMFNMSSSLMFARNNDVSNIENIIKAEEPLLRTFKIDYDGTIPPEIFCKNLKKEYPIIEFAEPIIIDSPLSGLYMPHDSLASKQSVLIKVKAIDAWDLWKGDSSVVIGISDCGVWQDHEDIINSIAPNWKEISGDGIDNDHDGYIDDFRGYNFSYIDDGRAPDDTYNSILLDGVAHGMAVAGIAGATTDNGKGIAGIGFKCRIFPLKVSKYDDSSILYGYESILYAAKRGLKVLNCSWGSTKMFSPIDQSLIDYAVSRDVAIVAAGGNDRKSITPTYPAAYRGVLDVGETDMGDLISSSTTLGSEIAIFAPGHPLYITTNDISGYDTEDGGGTSFAAPVVSGAVALIRSKYTELTAMQALEFTRQCVDDISLINYNNNIFKVYSKILPGRLNILKAFQMEPMSIPSIRPLKTNFYNKNQQAFNRLNQGDTALINIDAFNYLGDAKNLRFVLSDAFDLYQNITVIDSVVNIENAKANSGVNIGTFSITSNVSSYAKVILRVDIYGENDYHDFFMISYVPSSEVTTFSNNIISYSVGDRGHIGFVSSEGDVDSPQGVGFIYKNFGNQIFKAGLMAASSHSKVLTANFDAALTFSTDFNVIKPFIPPNNNIGILTDSLNQDPIGLDIQQVYNTTPNNYSIVKVDVTATNNGIRGDITDLSLGYYFDWDIYPDESSNKVEYFPEAVPETLKAVAAGAEIQYYVGKDTAAFCGCAVYSNDNNYVPQLAGLDYSMTKYFSLTDQLSSLYTGTNFQSTTIGDKQIVAGMKFPGVLKSKESRTYQFYFGCSDSRANLAEAFKNAMLGTPVSEIPVPVPVSDASIEINPQPAENTLTINISNTLNKQINIEYYDILGCKVIEDSKIFENGDNVILSKDITNLRPGVYFLKVSIGEMILSKKFVKI